KPRDQQRVEAVRAVETQHRLALRHQARGEIVEKPRDVRMAMKHGEARFRKRPGHAFWAALRSGEQRKGSSSSACSRHSRGMVAHRESLGQGTGRAEATELERVRSGP